MASNKRVPNEYAVDILQLIRHTATYYFMEYKKKKEAWSLFPKSSQSNTENKILIQKSITGIK